MSVQAEKMLISVPFLHLKLRASKPVSAAFQLFSVSLWAYIEDVSKVCVIFHAHTSTLPTYRPVMPCISSTFLCDQQEPVHPPKCFNCSREMIAGAFSHPGANNSSLVSSHSAGLDLLHAAKKWGRFPRSTKGRICPCSLHPVPHMEEEEVEGTGLCTQSGSRQAAWVQPQKGTQSSGVNWGSRHRV